MLVQDPNIGRLLVAYPTSPSSGVALARFDLNGQLDPTMGTGGVVTTGQRLSEGSSVGLAVDSRSRSLLAFVAYDGPQASRAAVTRYDADGTVDTAFGIAGSAAFPNDLRNAGVNVAVDPGGGVLLSAVPRTGPAANRAVVVRFTAAGVVDTAFGDQGLAVTHTSSNLCDVPVSFVVDPADGSIYVAIVPSNGQHARRPVVAKFGQSGQLDLGYGIAGYAVWQTDVSRGAMAVALDGLGRVLLAFACPELTVARINTTGHPDVAFGSGGAVSVSVGRSVSDSAGSSISVTADADHGVLVGLEINGHASVLRLDSDGDRDEDGDHDGDSDRDGGHRCMKSCSRC